MKQRNGTATRPWAGIVALAAATITAGALLESGAVSLGSILHPWYQTRAAGLIAFVLLWVSVVLGLLQSIGSLKGLTAPVANIDLHGFTALGALYATTFHAVILHWDAYVPFGWSEILVPFAGDYRPALVGLGVLAFYLALGAIVTTHLGSHVGNAAWRTIHLSTLAGFLLALLHGWLLGTDAVSPTVGYLYRFAAISVAVLLALRIFRGVWVHARAGHRR